MRHEAINDKSERPGRYALYWMQAAQRADWNPALDLAIGEAGRLGLPVVVVFGLTDRYPEAALRHYVFMLEGLRETARRLSALGIPLAVRRGAPDAVALAAADDAALVVCDMGHLRHQRQWRQTLARNAPCRVLAVETEVVVPVTVASDKAEWAARTFRPRIRRHLDAYLRPPPGPLAGPLVGAAPARPDRGLSDDFPGLDLSDIDAVLAPMAIDRSIPAVSAHFTGGAGAAEARFADFLKHRLPRYAENSNQPQADDISRISPYLHFGQISPLRLALSAQSCPHAGEAEKAAFLEQLIVRRELAFNFVHYNPDYDRFAGLPAWARKTLSEHRWDERPAMYDERALAAARTHDPCWNAAMTDMRETGHLHNYMRMYWGKKILEWSPDPETAFNATLALNNRYLLDGRDPNSYAGVGWIFGLHDRAWGERPVYGKTRSMTAAGLKRKRDMDAYMRLVAERTALSGGAGGLGERGDG